MANVNYQFFISMLIIALGYVSKRFKIVNEKDGEGLAKIIFNFTLPALVITTFSTIQVDLSLIMMPVICVVFGGFMSIIAILAFKYKKRKDRGMMSMLMQGFNIGLFAYPLVEAIWGQNGLKYFAMFDMGNAVLVFGVNYIFACYFASEEGSVNFKSILQKVSRSIPLLCYIITLAVNLSGFHFPAVVLDISKIVSKANMPLSLLLLGIFMSFSLEKNYLKSMAKILAFRYGIGLTVGITLYFLLPFDQNLRSSILIGLILPVAATVLPYSVEFGYNNKFVGTTTNVSIVISFILMWIMFGLGI